MRSGTNLTIVFHSLPHDKILELNAVQIVEVTYDRVRNVVAKGGNAGFPTMFSKDSFLRGYQNSSLCGIDLQQTSLKILVSMRNRINFHT